MNGPLCLLGNIAVMGDEDDGVALLLSAPAPEQSDGHLRLELAGQTFYIRLEQALNQEYLSSFAALQIRRISDL